jgi:uncharacterized membrane protein
MTAEPCAEHTQETSLLQHGMDRLTALVGLPGFAAALTAAIVLWIAANLLASWFGLRSVDPPLPFFWLQGALTTAALYVATLILTTQRREEKLSSQRAQLLRELAVLNDKKSAKIIELLEESRRDNPAVTDRAVSSERRLEARRRGRDNSRNWRLLRLKITGAVPVRVGLSFRTTLLLPHNVGPFAQTLIMRLMPIGLGISFGTSVL